jgi:hypothetical protein
MFGELFLRQYYTFYDMENGRIGLAGEYIEIEQGMPYYIMIVLVAC